MSSTGLDKISVTRRDDGVSVYTTLDGDIVGQICCRYYGYEWDTTEAVYAANPGLARMGPVLEAGVDIVLPEIQVKSSQGTVNLYD